MHYRVLGKSGLRISEIGFGCMSLGTNDADNEQLVHKAIALGINFFDTADMYEKGMNEIKIGSAIKAMRKDLVIATKVGNQWSAGGKNLEWNPRKEYILQAVEQSLRRLQTDYIDLYQLHGGTTADPILETIEAFEILKKQGKIRYYGISSIRPDVIREYIRLSDMTSVMMQYSLLDRRPEETCLSLLQENNIGVLARGSIAKGLLVNKPATAFLNYSVDEVSTAIASVAAVSGKQRSPAQTALHFALQHPAVTSAVAGTSNISQLEDVAGTIDTPPLSEMEMGSLRQSIPVNYYEQHR